MITKRLKIFPTEFRRTLSNLCCPECSGPMLEIERCFENGTLFVWYRCGRNDCEGQWLQKISPDVMNNFSKGFC
jgi:hypothetical protein